MSSLVSSEKILTVERSNATRHVAWIRARLVVLLMPSQVLISSVCLTAIFAVMNSLALGSFAHPPSPCELDVTASRRGSRSLHIVS